MERPHKRPRISFFADQSPDIELDSQRHQNDMVLKSRFETIFEKYSQDFSAVGDEIDLETGEIIVNNGHLEGMDDERDTGTTTRPGHQSATETSKSMLRAMTAMSVDEDTDNNFNSTADEVLMSIEEMAETAGFGLEDGIDSEDDLSDLPNDSSQGSGSAPLSELEGQSDHDSLFDVHDEGRQSSPDSLFAEETPASATKQNEALNEPGASTGGGLAMLEDPDDVAVLARFGPKVGQEVLQLLEKRQDAHIEPAWRVPANVRPKPTRTQSNTESHAPLAIPPSPIRDHGLWKAPRRQPKQQTLQKPPKEVVRAESEDPLQEDFSSDRDEEESMPQQRTVYEEEDSEDDYVPPKYLLRVVEKRRWNSDPVNAAFDAFLSEVDQDKRHEYEEALRMVEDGICYYCDAKHTCKQGTLAHWTRLVRKWRSGLANESIENHDMEFLYAYRGCREKYPRSQRFFIGDFRTLVELHEGAGMTFKEIVEADALRTRKTVGQLQDLYDQYRTPASSDYLRQGRREWKTEEENIMKELCKNPLNTVKSISGVLKDREVIEIGDRLADGWLAKLRSRRRESTVQSESLGQTAESMSPTPADELEDRPYIKQESDDEIQDGL